MDVTADLHRVRVRSEGGTSVASSNNLAAADSDGLSHDLADYDRAFGITGGGLS